MLRIALCSTFTALAIAVTGSTVGIQPASGKMVEIGEMTGTESVPSCPKDPCLAISRTTGYQAKVGAQRGLFVAPEDGRIVAWTVTLSTPTKKQVEFFNQKLGQPASAGISILQTGKRLAGRVVGQSPIIELTKYFGQTVQFPLEQSLPAKKGQLIALTVPTWAPALAVGLPGDTSWRASRTKDKCVDIETQTAQTKLNQNSRYTCLYRTARLLYKVTFITDPKETAISSKATSESPKKPAKKTGGNADPFAPQPAAPTVNPAEPVAPAAEPAAKPASKPKPAKKPKAGKKSKKSSRPAR